MSVGGADTIHSAGDTHWLAGYALLIDGRCRVLFTLSCCQLDTRIQDGRDRLIYCATSSHSARTRNESVPIQLAQCWFPGRAVYSANV